jgi:hypothetical protein
MGKGLEPHSHGQESTNLTPTNLFLPNWFFLFLVVIVFLRLHSVLRSGSDPALRFSIFGLDIFCFDFLNFLDLSWRKIRSLVLLRDHDQTQDCIL